MVARRHADAQAGRLLGGTSCGLEDTQALPRAIAPHELLDAVHQHAVKTVSIVFQHVIREVWLERLGNDTCWWIDGEQDNWEFLLVADLPFPVALSFSPRIDWRNRTSNRPHFTGRDSDEQRCRD